MLLPDKVHENSRSRTSSMPWGKSLRQVTVMVLEYMYSSTAWYILFSFKLIIFKKCVTQHVWETLTGNNRIVPKANLNFSSLSFVICLNHDNPQSCFCISSVVFTSFSKLLFWGFLWFKDEYTHHKNYSIYYDIAPNVKPSVLSNSGSNGQCLAKMTICADKNLVYWYMDFK